ncbi:hypothetical protein NBRC116493_25810 [Aurantivibrio infirmus]
MGIRCATELKKRFRSDCSISLFGDEPYSPYDRIKLSQLLAGTINYPDIFFNVEKDFHTQSNPRVDFQFRFARIVAIDTAKHHIRDSLNKRYEYDILILATGSKPHVPNIKGIDLKGVYTFRNIRDTESLLARGSRSRHIVVVGGGLLGLEAARGLQKNNTQVTLVHQSPRLMNRQLNETSAETLLDYVSRQGIAVITNDGLGEVKGDQRVQAILTRKNKRIECDTVVLCTGIKPNIDLAYSTGIRFNHGIVIDESLRTSIPGIYAVGECCEFNGDIFGLVAPGFEQATILAENLSGGQAIFRGTQPYTNLKVMDVAVSSMGEVADLPSRPKLSVINYSRKNKLTNKNESRSLAIYKNKILGACAVGDWPELQRVREAFIGKKFLFPWQTLLFRSTGNLWLLKQEENIAAWPATAIVCQCNQVTRAVIDLKISEGCYSLAAVSRTCGAGAVCGSCQPLIETLIRNRSPIEGTNSANNESPLIYDNTLLALTLLCFIALIVATFTWVMPGIEAPLSVQQKSLSWLWTDSRLKQISGFSLLSATVIGLILSLRKRLGWSFLGKFSRWRTIHAGIGALTLLILFAHTGMHLGENLNRLLMLNFLMAATLGAIAGIAIGLLKNSGLRSKVRRASFWLHIVTIWPLPVLVSAHIVSTYYF